MLKWNEELKFHFDIYGSYSVWWLFMHNSYDLPSSAEWKAASIYKNKRVKVSWKLRSFKLLEKPFETDCLDYRLNTKHLSRKACIRDCKIKTSIKECQVIDNTIDLFKEDPVMNFSSSNEAWCIKQIDFDTICEKECPHYDCNIDYFEPITIHEIYAPDMPLEINIPTKPETAFHIEPKFETIEFICYIASTFGIWFGFSLFQLHSLGTLFQKYLSKIFRSYKLFIRRPGDYRFQVNRVSISNNIHLY